jgi:uncharacterized protein (DUF4415 family)
MKKKNTYRTMPAELDFSKLKRIQNPYPAMMKQPITIRLDVPTVIYFKQLADQFGMSYQNLINLYLRECVAQKKKPAFGWRP